MSPARYIRSCGNLVMQRRAFRPLLGAGGSALRSGV